MKLPCGRRRKTEKYSSSASSFYRDYVCIPGYGVKRLSRGLLWNVPPKLKYSFRAGLNLAALALRGELSTVRAIEGRLRRTRLARYNLVALVAHSVHKCPQLSRARGMPQFAQRLGFDLSNAFAGNCERLPDFF